MKLLEDFRQGALPPGTTDEQLWKAQKIKQVRPCVGNGSSRPDQQERKSTLLRM